MNASTGKRVFISLMMISAAVVYTRAERLEEIPNPKARDNTWVTDLPGMLRPESVSQLNSLITQLQNDTSAEVGVAIIRSLDGRPERELAIELFRRWGVGKRKKNNGVLVLWAVKDRRVAVEVGYGLEGILPDGKVGIILDRYIITNFKAGDYDKGLIEGLKVIASVIRSEPVDIPGPSQAYPTEPQARSSTQSRPSVPPGQGPINSDGLGIILAFGILLAAGGAFAGYRVWWRHHDRVCASCNTKMTRLAEEDDDEFLDEGSRTEESLRSVDYDVWKCPNCSHHFTLRYPRWLSS
jgi:uncharacterized protein